MGVQSIAFQPDERGKKIGCAATTTQNVICKLFKTFLREQTKDDYRMFNFSCSFTETLNSPSIVRKYKPFPLEGPCWRQHSISL